MRSRQLPQGQSQAVECWLSEGCIAGGIPVVSGKVRLLTYSEFRLHKLGKEPTVNRSGNHACSSVTFLRQNGRHKSDGTGWPGEAIRMQSVVNVGQSLSSCDNRSGKGGSFHTRGMAALPSCINGFCEDRQETGIFLRHVCGVSSHMYVQVNGEIAIPGVTLPARPVSPGHNRPKVPGLPRKRSEPGSVRGQSVSSRAWIASQVIILSSSARPSAGRMDVGAPSVSTLWRDPKYSNQVIES